MPDTVSFLAGLLSLGLNDVPFRDAIHAVTPRGLQVQNYLCDQSL